MTFYAFGLNHETAPVALREAFALDAEAHPALLAALALTDDAEVVLLSTCNRTEAYLYGTPADRIAVVEALAAHAGRAWPFEATFDVQDEDAILHVLEVTCGLRSLVLGDAQILTQVKDAYRRAADAERVGAVLHRLMHTAFRAAKRVINETALQSGQATVSAAAVAAARRYAQARTPEGLHACRVLVVGAGEMARLALDAFAALEPAALTVTNRTPARAEALAAATGAGTVAWADRHAAAARADVVLVATAALEPVLRAEVLPDGEALFVDIAVPRNVDPAIHGRDGYTVIDLDRLDAALLEAVQVRRAAAPGAVRICEEARAEYVTWFFHQQALQPAIHAIRDTFEAIRLQEIERHHGRFSELDRTELDHLTRSMLQKLLAVPVVRLKNVEPESIDFVRGIKLLHALFSRPDCEDDSAQAAPGPPARTTDAPPQAVPPLQCPFELPDEAATQNPDRALRDALRS